MVSAVVAPLGSDGLQGTPFDLGEVLLLQRQGFDAFNFGIGQVPLAGDEDRAVPLRRPPVWMFTVGIYLLITIGALRGAARRVRAPAARIRALRSRNGGS
jgi:hypothetical protein